MANSIFVFFYIQSSVFGFALPILFEYCAQVQHSKITGKRKKKMNAFEKSPKSIVPIEREKITTTFK